MPGALGQAGAGHALAQAALIEEIPFLTAEQLIEQVAGDFDQTHEDVGADGRVGMLDAFAKGLIICAACSVQAAEALGVAVVRLPFRNVPVAHEIAVVFEQFLLAGARHIGELDLSLFGSAGGLATLEDVLFPGAGRLDHLVVGAVALLQEAVTEIARAVIDHQGLLVAEKVFVTTVGRDEALEVLWLIRGTQGT